MLGRRRALGIDISNGQVSLALLEKGRRGVRLLRAASAVIPDGVMENDNVKNAAALARCIKKLKSKARIHCSRAAVSVVANPILMQVIDVPKDAVGNMRKFVSEQVKHYAALPIKTSLMDYCGIRSVGRGGRRRAFVVATDGRKVAEAARSLHRSGMGIEVIEPPVVSYIRACSDTKIACEFDKTLLYVTVHDGTVVFSVFRHGTLDYVRTKQVRSDALCSREFRDWLAREAGAIMQFYELNASVRTDAWEVTVVAGVEGEQADEISGCMREALGGVKVRAFSHGDAYLDTPVSQHKSRAKPSAVAVGLAMGLLDPDDSGLRINLLPDQVRHTGTMERRILVGANVAAAILLIMILSVVFLTNRVSEVSADMAHARGSDMSRAVHQLAEENKALEAQATERQTRATALEQVLDAGASVEWAAVLGDIRSAIPETVRITGLLHTGGSGVTIEGLAMSYEAVQLFAETLGECEHVASASLLESRGDETQEGLIRYSIGCSVFPGGAVR